MLDSNLLVTAYDSALTEKIIDMCTPIPAPLRGFSILTPQPKITIGNGTIIAVKKFKASEESTIASEYYDIEWDITVTDIQHQVKQFTIITKHIPPEQVTGIADKLSDC